MADIKNEIVPPALLDRNGSYNIEVYEKSYVVIQHDPSAKVIMTEMFTDNGHTLIQTDLNYTGMLWKDSNVTSLLNIVNMENVHFAFMPFNMRKWPVKIEPTFLATEGLSQDALLCNKYLEAVVEKFTYKDLFDHLEVPCLRVGIRVHCFWGEASEQAKKIKEEICWVLQFEALRNRLCWHVVNYTSNEKCDITLVVTISQKCYMTGIEIRRPQTRLPGEISIEGLSMVWPFLHAAESVRVVDFWIGGKFQSICILTHRRAVAAFLQVNQRKPFSKEKTICWVPLIWTWSKIHELREKMIPSYYNKEISDDLLLIQQFLRVLKNVNNAQQNDPTISTRWVA